MAFHVPEKNTELYREVRQRFKILLKKRIITGIDEDALDLWLANFRGDTEQYFAASVLSRLTFRSRSMIESSIDHALHCLLPPALRKQGLFPHADIESFLTALQKPDSKSPIRFVAVDGHRERDAGKSGPVVIRRYRHANINTDHMCRLEHIQGLQPHVNCIVFVDDMLGTGKQFEKFAKTHKLESQQSRWHMIYCPLVAFHSGVDHLQQVCPWLQVLPIETLNDSHKFFCGHKDDPGLWAVDAENTVDDARAFYENLTSGRGIPSFTQHGLELLLGFEDSAPNNTLSVLWANSDDWTSLLKR